MLLRYLIISFALVFSSLSFSENLYVVVASNSPINEISNEQLKRIFLSTEPAFPNGKKATPYDLKNRRAFRAFYKAIAKKSRLQVKTYWSELMFSGKGLPPETISDEHSMPDVAENDTSFISYTTQEPYETLKVIKIISY